MRVFVFILLATLSSFSLFQSNNLNEIDNQYDNLVGEWILDLRPSPDADPYFQSLIISNKDGKNFSGLFYGSPIQEAYFNESWSKLYFAFKSSDSSNEYFQSGYVIGNEIFGVTYCPARNFVMPWTGKRAKEK